jgi:hypothetical protein
MNGHEKLKRILAEVNEQVQSGMALVGSNFKVTASRPRTDYEFHISLVNRDQDQARVPALFISDEEGDLHAYCQRCGAKVPKEANA